jgi:hypothetical protein
MKIKGSATPGRILPSLPALLTQCGHWAQLGQDLLAELDDSGFYRSPAPEYRHRLEPPPSLAQRSRHRDLVAGLPARHRTDGEMKLGLVGLPSPTVFAF